jgi:hypothetical protein
MRLWRRVQIIGALTRLGQNPSHESGTLNVQTNNTNYMSGEVFADLKEALKDALAFERVCAR